MLPDIGLILLQYALQLTILLCDARIIRFVPPQLDHVFYNIFHDSDEAGCRLLYGLLFLDGLEYDVTLLRQVFDLVEELLQPYIVL